MANHAYFEVDGVGDWYACVDPASPGESPLTAPAKWVKLEIPSFMEDAIVELAVAYLQGGDGQQDKRRDQRREGETALMNAFKLHGPKGDYRSLPMRTR